ncbi:uncharacterized protein EI90DRAFT_3050957 [Cantharellus anzutake]|uniref:uncharacterized protein n=1 Tax=Cantharellus anzutake TaxID=1750568 RepID=UPI001908B318|nr:uncharacterized protein EI90DRAFT_3050957 [Cantharellus anzutake]KAF8334093.1 hypothetical protein EI90DRAFT_3050957 [Cantharellus anzutake]
MTEKITVPKLRGVENYTSWSADLRIILKHHKRWTWIEGANENAPPTFITDASSTKPNPDYATWEEGADDAMFRIVMTF